MNAIELLESLITDYLIKKEELEVENKKNSFLFNPLRFFAIDEAKHSFLLAKLLDPYAEHGQGNLFLKSFLELLDIKDCDKGNWIVSVEKGRIDILIKRKDPLSVIIIENKSNNAVDQENQLYRYWYQEIYKPNFRGRNIDEISNNNFQIIYLTPDETKLPSENSMKRPIGYNEDLPEKIPLEPKKWTFNKHIIKWLNNAISQLDSGNYRLREHLNQYIEIWA